MTDKITLHATLFFVLYQTCKIYRISLLLVTGGWVNPGLTNKRQAGMKPRLGRNRFVPLGADCNHAAGISSQRTSIGRLQVSCIDPCTQECLD